MNEDLYIGTIRRCTSYKVSGHYNIVELVGNLRIVHSSIRRDTYTSEVYKENAILIRTINDGYIDIDTMDNNLELKLIGLKENSIISPTGKILDITPKWEDQLYVDESTLEHLNNKCKPLTKSIKSSCIL